jgi:hypothetical protein
MVGLAPRQALAGRQSKGRIESQTESKDASEIKTLLQKEVVP